MLIQEEVGEGGSPILSKNGQQVPTYPGSGNVCLNWACQPELIQMIKVFSLESGLTNLVRGL